MSHRVLIVCEILAVFFCVHAFASSSVIWCQDSLTHQKREIDSRLVPGEDSCVTAVIWADKNVCFGGSAEGLVQRINQGDYVWPNVGLLIQDAKVISGGAGVQYLAVDQRNFYSSEREIISCD